MEQFKKDESNDTKNDLHHLNNICKWYWKHLILLLKEIEKSKPTIEITTKAEALTMYETMENISLELETKSRHLIANTRNRFQKFNLQKFEESSSTDNSTILNKSNALKRNKLSLKKRNSSVYTNDDLSFGNIYQKSKGKYIIIN